jgi:hypothetical protein
MGLKIWGILSKQAKAVPISSMEQNELKTIKV